MTDATGTAALPTRDAAAARVSAGGDDALADELLETLLAGLPAELADLRACLSDSDWLGLAESAHHIRGATRYCGVPALDAAIEALERAARIGDPARSAETFRDVETQTQRLRAQTG
ncbi:Hpt domain-containing protein [uncultured Thiocystis sp.]|jgi:two-component system sensor histidine kinase BarA|uniref:Hpt domain-containing protein n=1 Tax=uncultured Thiocystis sp. TaxID=1202134 RepID=UPI0025D6D59B|nr:Hpt domain-containing protein [uncultured Thiocystis sp.]